MTPTRAIVLPFAALLALLAGAQVKAFTPPELLRVRVAAPLVAVQGGDVGPAAAAAAARRATGGRVLNVNGRRSGDQTIYRVKVLLPGGRVRTVTVDGGSGQVRG